MVVGKAVIDRISDLERKLCCKTRYVDNLDNTITVNPTD